METSYGTEIPSTSLGSDLQHYVHRLLPLGRVPGDCLARLHVVGAFSELLKLNASTGFIGTIWRSHGQPSQCCAAFAS